jgi:hypothetical protein
LWWCPDLRCAPRAGTIGPDDDLKGLANGIVGELIFVLLADGLQRSPSLVRDLVGNLIELGLVAEVLLHDAVKRFARGFDALLDRTVAEVQLGRFAHAPLKPRASESLRLRLTGRCRFSHQQALVVRKLRV